MGTSLLQEQHEMFTMLLNQRLASNSVSEPGRHRQVPKGPISQCPDEQTLVILISGAMWSVDLQRR